MSGIFGSRGQSRRLANVPDQRVAFLGLGIMGRPMAENLARAGFELAVWNRTGERATEFAGEFENATAAPTPAEAARPADIVITMLPDSPEVEEVLLGSAAEGLTEGKLAIDMSTIAPTASRAIGERLRELGVGFLDAPVTGSRPKAEDGTLTIMVGGEQEDFDRARPVLEAMGELVLRVGPQGHGSMVKLINNTVAATNAAVLAETLVMAQKAGLDTAALRQVMGAGSGNSTMLQLKAEPMFEHELDPLFKLEHMLKDVRHCLREAEALAVPLRVAAEAERLYERAAEKGLGERDFAAIVLVSEDDSGIQRDKKA
jgi:3-hydroxyisobutyrate dehydrogenase-like beta-hydroxyacid dehydrogenase